MSNKNITILGATGYVGVQLAARLNARGYHIKALTRRKCRHKDLMVLSNVTIIETDTHDQASLEQHFKGSLAVINLVGILNEAGKTTHTFQNAHVELAKKTINACKASGVTRLLHMSALNADAEKGGSQYLKTKGLGEAAVFAAAGGDVAVTAFRPSVIFGAEDSFFNRFAGLIKLLPVFPLACGSSKFAPVYVGDVCDRIMEALEDSSTVGKSINLVGPKEYTLKDLVNYTGRMVGVDIKIIDLPNWAAKLQAKIMGLVPGKPFSMDNYNSLQTDSTCDEDGAKQKTSIEAVVPGYIGHNDKNKRFQSYRVQAKRD